MLLSRTPPPSGLGLSDVNGERSQPAQRSRKSKAAQPGHEVELRRPDVPKGAGVMDQTPAPLDPVVRPCDLADEVVEGLDPDVGWFEA